MSRTSLTRTQPSFALGSYAAFKQVGDQATVMGDLVLLDEEVSPVMTRLFQNGFTLTALHNHLNQVSPHVMYLHYFGQGDAVKLASALHDALSASGTPLTGPTSGGAAPTTELDTKQLESILGHSGTVAQGGVFQVNVPRAEQITMAGMEIPPAMGVTTSFNFQPTGGGNAAITGDFVLLGSEVNAVAQTLQGGGIDVTAVHNHALDNEPRLFYMHFWANGNPATLARVLRSALDQTNSVKGSAS